MRKDVSELRTRSVFRIIEKPEGMESRKDDMLDKLENLEREVVKLGRSLIQMRTFSMTEYQSLKEAVEALQNSDQDEDMLINSLLSIADGLESGLRVKNEASGIELGPWIRGMEIVYERVIELLEKLKIKPIYSSGKPFDPSLHKAVAVEYNPWVDENTILAEHRRGYMRGNKVIRYAEVVVNKKT